MSRYDEAKKGARYTMCQAALQGGADISIVPNVMEYIETGNPDALKLITPCEKAEQDIAATTSKYKELESMSEKLSQAYDTLQKKFSEQKAAHRSLLKECFEFQCEIRAKERELHEIAPECRAMTLNEVVIDLSSLRASYQTGNNTRAYIQVGEYLIAVTKVKILNGKPILVAGGKDDTNPSSMFKILPDHTLERCRDFADRFNEIHDELGKHMVMVRDIDKKDFGVPHRFSDGEQIISIAL